MAATVQLIAGDLFEGPSDLIVLPCSTVPTFSKFVLKRLQQFDIPAPRDPMQLGEVRFAPLEAS